MGKFDKTETVSAHAVVVSESVAIGALVVCILVALVLLFLVFHVTCKHSLCELMCLIDHLLLLLLAGYGQPPSKHYMLSTVNWQ